VARLIQSAHGRRCLDADRASRGNARFLTTALFQLRGEVGQLGRELRREFREGCAGLRSEFRAELAELRGEFGSELAELRREMREGFRAHGERIDVLAARIDAHLDRHAG